MRIFKNIMSLLVLAPIMPFMLIALLGQSLVRFADWSCERGWAEKLLSLSEKLVK